MFRSVEGSVDFPRLEAQVGRFWRDRGIYERSLALRKEQHAPKFVFYEGPPTANGMPHPGHCLTRAIKDLFPRYKTMRGFYCRRKAGWDTHGLPVEVEVCKELGIHAKEEIEAYGVEPFIHRCQHSVWRYMKEWEQLTQRLGFWIHLDEAYATYHQSYVESVWWSLKNLFDRGLLYQGYKIVWWWAQGGTALSAGEVGQGYRQVADPSVYVKFPLLDDAGRRTDTSLLVWTTTPWTLPSNQFAAVHPELDYVTVDDGEHGKLILAASLREEIVGKVKRDLPVVATCKGRNLICRRYVPPFECYYDRLHDIRAVRTVSDPVERLRGVTRIPDDLPPERKGVGATEDFIRGEVDAAFHRLEVTGAGVGYGVDHFAFDYVPLAWRVLGADFVTVDSGTGVVHVAPAFGEADFDVLDKEQLRFIDPRPELIFAVGPDGKFTDEGPEYCRGRWVKDCDKDICRDLRHRGLLYHQEQYLHDCSFCWRAEEDQLIPYPRRSWFIRTTQFKDAMLANNAQINWLPEHIRDGRFGNFLETNVDWALSRERYWGTPLPIWVCSETGKMEAVGSYDELMAKPGVQGTEVWEAAKEKNPELPDDLKVHKPYIDEVTYDSPFADGGRMRRVTEVIDCWYDSGAMPFAQWGYRGEDGPENARRQFHDQFPADFISEALDQTRGWFYSLLAISTMVHGEGLGAGDSGFGARDGAEFKRIPTSPQSPAPSPQPPYPHPFRNCIVLGLMLGEDGQKMSKSKRNYREPSEIFDKYGADALRWYFFANQAPWTSIRYSEQAIKDSIPEFLLRLWNCYSFFVIYANIDGFDPAEKLAGSWAHRRQETPPTASRDTPPTVSRDTPPTVSREAAPTASRETERMPNQEASLIQHREASPTQLTCDELSRADDYRPIAERGELDRWILSELNRAAARVVAAMDAYDNYGACGQITEFVNALSNWYVRRSRDRFWAEDKKSPDKLDAYWTLYECLVTTCKLVAPFVPFLADGIWRNLVGEALGGRAVESAHLCDYPTGDPAIVDEPLSVRMSLVREIVSLGRAARTSAKMKVRQPLSKVEVILTDAAHRAWLESHDSLVCDELNVKKVEYTTRADEYISYHIQPNLKRLGPRVGKLLPALKKSLAEADGGKMMAQLTTDGRVTLAVDGQDVELDAEDIQVRLQAKEGWAAAEGKACVVVLSTELTDELVAEGLAREVVRAIQERRKEMACDYTDRIVVGLVMEDAALAAAVRAYATYIQGETLATTLTDKPLAGVTASEVKIEGKLVSLYVQVVPH